MASRGDARDSQSQSQSQAVIRVAHVGGYARDSASGPQRAVAGILQHLPDHGVEVELWQFARNAKEVSWQEIDGIPVLRLPRRRRVPGFLIGLPDKTRAALRTRSSQVDLVHFHSVFISEYTRAGLLLEIPYVISPRGGYNRLVLHGRNRLAKQIWLAAYERRYLTSAKALNAVSPGEAAELENLVSRDQIFYVPNGIDREALDRPIKEPDGKTMLFLGRLAVQHKGLDRLLAGYSLFLNDSGDQSSDLVLAGPDFRGDKDRIEGQIRDLGLQDRVSLTGGVFGQDKWDLIERAYAFVLTSRWEGMPFALLEALAAGRPALVTPETNMGALVEEYGAGFNTTGDTKEISRGIEALLALSQEQYVEMQYQARRLIQDQFTWERTTGELAARYRDILRTT